MVRAATGEDALAQWLEDGYVTAYRTAYGLLGNRVDAEDAVQEAFLRAWRFRAAVPSGEGTGAWMYRVVVNASLSKLRHDGRRRALPLGPEVASPGVGQAPAEDPARAAVAADARDLVLAALAVLPEHLRVVVVLRYYSGLSEREIAQVIHRRPGTVKSRLHAARAQLGGDARLSGLIDGDVVGPGRTAPMTGGR